MIDVSNITSEDYALHQGKRYSKFLKEWVPVTEIRLPSIGRQLVGYIVASENYLHGTAELVDGSTRSLGFCTLDTTMNRESMIRDVIVLWLKEAGY